MVVEVLVDDVPPEEGAVSGIVVVSSESSYAWTLMLSDNKHINIIHIMLLRGRFSLM